MIITTTDFHATIKYGKETSTHALNTISYTLHEESEGITLFRNNEPIGTSPIGKVSVNNEYLTRDNMENLLSNLFVSKSASVGAGTTQVQTDYLEENTAHTAHLRNRPFSKIQTGDSFPQPIASGHICEEYDNQGTLKYTYSWDGFVWIKTGADYNLIFDKYDAYYDYSDLGSFFKIWGKTHYLLVEKNTSEDNLYLSVSNIDKITNDYRIDYLQYYLEKDRQSIILDNLNIGSYQFTKDWKNQDTILLDTLEIKNGKNFHDVHINDLIISQVVIENMESGNEDGSSYGGNIQVGGNHVFIRNNKNIGAISVNIPSADEVYTPDKTIEISGNEFTDSSGQIQLYGDNSSNNEYTLTCINNSQCSDIYLYYLHAITDLQINFDAEHLQSLQIRDCTFTEQALQSLINTLATTPLSNQVTLSYVNNQPALTQEQIDTLTANNIHVQVK